MIFVLGRLGDRTHTAELVGAPVLFVRDTFIENGLPRRFRVHGVVRIDPKSTATTTLSLLSLHEGLSERPMVDLAIAQSGTLKTSAWARPPRNTIGVLVRVTGGGEVVSAQIEVDA